MVTRFSRLFAAVAVAASVVMVTHTPVANASVPSPFDSTFGTDGIVTHELPLQRSESVAVDVISDLSGNQYALLVASAGTGDAIVSVGKFSSNGSVISAYGTNGRSQEVRISGPNFALQADGKIVIAGFQYTNSQLKIAVYRLTASGQIDTTFGVDGAYIIPSFPGKSIESSSLLLALNQSIDRIHIAFNINNIQGNNNNFYFIALDVDGQLDYNWSNGGAEEVVPLGGPVSAYNSLNNIQLLSDGSLLGIGSAMSSNGVRAIVLTKLNANGFVDSTFDGASNGNGVVFIPFASESDAFMTASVVFQDDSLVLAGLVGTYFSGPWYYGATKVLSDGTVDTTFGTNGFSKSTLQNDFTTLLPTRIGLQPDGRYVFTINSGTTSGFMRIETNGTFSNSPNCSQCLWSGANDGVQATSLLVQTDGKVVVTGQHRTSKNSIIRRFTTAGSADGTFNDSDIEIKGEQWDSYIHHIEPQADGSILGLGAASVVRGPDDIYRGLLFKFTSSGALDTQFGLGGYQFLSPPTDQFWVNILDFVVLSNGKILVLGSGQDNQNVDPSVMLWRLNSNGTLDNSFGTNGFTITTESGAELSPVGLIINSDGKILVPLSRSVNWVGAPWIYRYTDTGVLDSSFTDSQNFAGGVKPTIGDGSGYLSYAFPADAGKFYVAGSTSINATTHSYLARFLPNGTLDTSFAGGYVSWDVQAQNSMNYITNVYVEGNGKIFVLGTTTSPAKTGLIVQLNSDGGRNNSFNGSGYATIAYRNPAQIDYSEPLDWVVNDGVFTIIGGGDSNPHQYRSANFSGVARMSLSAVMDSSFGTNGILDPFPTQETFFSDIAPLSGEMNLVAGMLKQGNDYKVILMKIGPTTSAPTTTVPPVSSPPTSAPATTLPPTTSPQLTTSTTVPATNTAADETIKLVLSVSQAAIVKRMKLKIPAGSKVVMKSSTTKVCRVVKTKVVAASTGTCRISVTVTDKKKKKTTKSTSFKVT